jgi:hypothetical protein
MGFLKGFLTTILMIIFFFTLGIFSLAFMIHGTLLSADFVSNQVEKMPISSITRDITEDQIGDVLPQDSEFLTEVAYKIIESQEPWIKTHLKDAITTGYDYFLGKTNYLSITVPLSDLKENIKNSFWGEMGDYLHEELAGKSDAEISSYLQNMILQLPEDILPAEFDTLPSAERNLYLEQYLREIAGVPPKSGAPPLDPHKKSLADQYVNDFINHFVNKIPNSYIIDESSIGSDTMHTFQNIRQYIGYFQTYYYWLIVLLVVLIGLIFLVNWGVKVPARALGIELLFIGIIDLVGIFILRSLPFTQWITNTGHFDISPALNTWIQGLINDITWVALPLSIGILVIGIALLVLSIVLPSRERGVLA